MKPRFIKAITAIVGLLLAIGTSVVLPAVGADATPNVPDAVETAESPTSVEAPTTAEAPTRVLNFYDDWSKYYCIKHRPSNTFVIHSWPYALWPGGVGYWCQWRSNDSTAEWQSWVHVEPPYSANSWRPWGYHPCGYCGTPGHN